MNHFPIYIKTADKRVCIIGNADNAVAKAHLVGKSEAVIEVYADAPAVALKDFIKTAGDSLIHKSRALRHLGYEGRIIAVGALVSDQYRHARQSGFDGVLITKAQAAKMPESHWLEQAQRVATTYSVRIYA